METELTKRIKNLTHFYRPKLNTKMRTIRWADEVWTPTGIVDSIRFEDYYANEEYLCKLLDFARFSTKEQESLARLYKLGKCFRDESTIKDKKECVACIFRNHFWNIGMMITCFEVKISYADFKSENGHNFHGNENYYCVPKSLAPKIEKQISDEIGILVYFEGQKKYGLREYRPSRWREVSDKIKVDLLYNAMKKWCDGTICL